MTEKNVQQLNLTANQLTASQLEQLNQLLNWLENGELTTASMREIKLAFPNWDDVDTELDFYVQKGFISRQDRRYQRLIPTLAASEMAKSVAQAKKIAIEMVETNEWLEVHLIKEPWLVSLALYQMSQQASAQSVYFLPEVGYDFRQLSCQKSDNYLFLDHVLASGTQQLNGLANYFSNPLFTEFDQAVYKAIGDVNPAFFLEMTGKQLELLADKQQPRQNKESIFLKVLVILGYVQEQAANYQLTKELTFISEKELAQKEVEIQDQLSRLIEEKIRTQNELMNKKLVELLLFNELLARTNKQEVIAFT